VKTGAVKRNGGLGERRAMTSGAWWARRGLAALGRILAHSWLVLVMSWYLLAGLGVFLAYLAWARLTAGAGEWRAGAEDELHRGLAIPRHFGCGP
jgi:hypothetical protein